MAKFIINKEVIRNLKPCADRYENYLRHYTDFEGDLNEFFELTEISYVDKLWVSLRLLDRTSVEAFALDCAVSAQKISANVSYTTAAAAAAADAAYAAAYAADAAYAAAYASYAADAADAAYAAAADAAYAAAADAAAYAAAADAADAADAAAADAAYAAAADAAAADAAAAAERERQLEAILWIADKA